MWICPLNVTLPREKLRDAEHSFFFFFAQHSFTPSLPFLFTRNKQDVFDKAKIVLDKMGTVDILVNNAGIVSGKPLLELRESSIRRTFDVNVIGHFWTIQVLFCFVLSAPRLSLAIFLSLPPKTQ